MTERKRDRDISVEREIEGKIMRNYPYLTSS